MVWRCLLILLLTSSVAQRSEQSCLPQSEWFDCQDIFPTCIKREWVCNGREDCHNGLDESHCSLQKSRCSPEFFLCKNGECISPDFKCNGLADCRDGSDEAGCDQNLSSVSLEWKSPRPTRVIQNSVWAAVLNSFESCTAPMYQCQAGGPCIVHKAVCDGEEDCPLGDDEVNCTVSVKKQCPDGAFKCRTSDVCVPQQWVCDRSNDCRDGSDEANCASMDSQTFDVQANQELCGSLEFRCSGLSGTCIPLNKTCDSVRDCANGDDEGSECSICLSMGCHYKCHIFKGLGAKCVCPDGSQLSSDSISCTDVDECETLEGRQCAHYCENGRNRYTCACAPGYVLGSDGHSCKIISQEEGSLLVAVGNEIRRMPLLGPNPSFHEVYEVALSLPSSDGIIRSVSHMHRNNAFFFSISRKEPDGELAVSRNGKLEVLRERVAGIANVAVDWIGGGVFYTQRYPSTRPGISVCTMNGFFCRMIIQGRESVVNDLAKRQGYHGLALDPLRGIMVWIEKYNGWARINSANMDGSNVRTLVDEKLGEPSGLAIDAIRREVYFCDLFNEMIEKIHMDTLERSIVHTAGVRHASELSFFNGYLYWSDWGTEQVKVLELSADHSTSHVLHSFNRYPYGITVNHTFYQPRPLVDPCSTSLCDWICVAVPGPDNHLHPKCLCPDYYEYISELDSCRLKEEPYEIDNEAHVGVSFMKESCERNVGCKNGGMCEDVVNEHDRVINVICRCAPGFGGLYCEYATEFAQEEESSASHYFATILYCVIILGFFVTAFYLAYSNRSVVSGFTKHSVRHVSSLKVPHFAALTTSLNAARERFRNRTNRRAPIIDIAGSQFANLSYEPAPTSATSLNPSAFNNPVYAEIDSSSAAPYGSEAIFSSHVVH